MKSHKPYSMKGSKVQTGLRLNEPLYEKVCALANMENRSINNLIEYALQKHIQDYEEVNGVIELPVE